MITMHINQKGETIVEVLLAIVVLASALGGAFAIASRSSNTMQDSKEHYQAQLYANSQADTLRAHVSSSLNKNKLDNDYLYTNAPFCMDSGGAPVAFSPAACTKTNGGAEYKITIQSNYIAGDTSTNDIYLISIEWPSIIQGSTSKVEMVYGI